jgi:transposase
VTVENEDIVNSKPSCKILHKLRYKCGPGRISIVLENAKYQHCDLVRIRAKKLGIELVFLPAYSPNLNLIENIGSTLKNLFKFKVPFCFLGFLEFGS